ncbi:MAG TPA: matrixin family metalloprotease [Polyangiaceae bacterium]|jgi:hypothetical protein
MSAVGVLFWSEGAGAFALKHTSSGAPMRWTSDRVSYVIDPSVEANVPGGSQAVSSSVNGWSGAAGGPMLSTSVGPGNAQPGLDGQNTVVFAPDGFAAAGGALAVTVTSYNDTTGEIVDADIVINGTHSFAVLPASAQPGAGVAPVSTDGSGGGNGVLGTMPFDLVHVVSHEVGHSLGLADEQADNSALMYAFSTPGDPSPRAPSSDDVDGVDAIYGATATSGLAAAGERAGCGQASVAGSRTRPSDAWVALAFVGVAGVWLASRRRIKAVRVALPAGAALFALVAGAGAAHSAPSVVRPGDASVRVVAASTTNVRGLFVTTLELEATACRTTSCPARARAQAWGGTVGGITQQIGGGVPVPAVGDVVDVTFSRAVAAVDGAAAADQVAPMAVLVAPRP